MIDLIGKKMALVQCSDPSMIGVRGIYALESMKTITILSGNTKRTVQKLGTVLQVQDGGRLVVADEMVGRIEDRLARGAKV
ncbi:MAG: ribonuclease P protein subunit [Thaumarchaeota archaeon]|nr:ribonuclease P protein subunit [Nitrososphaerota archaeon]